ncbi:MAG: antibiotic biosynthesis monooxygenase [Gammaproteobacteria bacterium]|nr:antibiotic biosynthesis monooxygenase [Gammaproteobacteria bacterium]
MPETGPVTISTARRIRPGMEAAYEAWVRQIIAAATRFPGHLGVDVLRPAPGSGGEYVLLTRFDSYRNQIAWEHSGERAELLEQLSEMTDGETKVSKVSGLEFWFALPEVPAQAKPNRHKMALLLCGVVFLLVLAINLSAGEQLARLPLAVRAAVLSIAQVLLLTYIVMPRITALLKSWLYGLEQD